MRTWGWLAAGFVAALIGTASVFGQPGPFGGQGIGVRSYPVQLLRNASVKKELDLTDEQAEKLPDAVRKVLKDVLNDKQMKRLEQIELQQRGGPRFRTRRYSKSSKLHLRQTKNSTRIFDDLSNSEDGRHGQGRVWPRVVQEVRRPVARRRPRRRRGVLTSDQRKVEAI